MPPLSAQGHSYTDLLGSLLNQKSKNAVNTNRRQEQGDACESTHDHHRESLLRCAKGDHIFHRTYLVHDEIGCEAPKPIAKELLGRMMHHMNTADSGHLLVPVESEGGTGLRWTDAH